MINLNMPLHNFEFMWFSMYFSLEIFYQNNYLFYNNYNTIKNNYSTMLWKIYYSSDKRIKDSMFDGIFIFSIRI